ncbi:hypothetical protein DFJ73DRAFT_916132 [Zopfochytrium polystomum]|nr:hypothetical protein DFJ73DRAFT_916132 [Zopfochytrium polystomum]
MPFVQLTVTSIALGALIGPAFAQQSFYVGNLVQQVFPRIAGWSDDSPVFVYLFDNNLSNISSTLLTAPIYTFRADGQLSSAQTQPNLIDVVPGDAAYSDLWQVNIIKTGTYTANITSFKQLSALLANQTVTLTPTETYVNCPVAHPQSTLANASDGKTVTGFYRDQLVRYFDFGVNGNPPNNYTAPVYVPTAANGTGVGAHVFPTPNVATDVGYTAFWQVTTVPVPDGNPTQWAGTKVVRSGKFVNCPVVAVGTKTPYTAGAGSTTTTTTTTSKSGAALSAPMSAIWIAGALAGAVGLLVL